MEDNRGGEDAFTHDPHAIGFDVERLNALYGDAESDRNAVLIDHLFRHEYTHLLQKAWVRDHPLRTDTPLRSALADMWLEGLGNYYSLSDSLSAREKGGAIGNSFGSEEWALCGSHCRFIFDRSAA